MEVGDARSVLEWAVRRALVWRHPLGPEAIRLVQRLRERSYAERTCRDYGHAVVHLGRYLHEELESDRGSKTSEPPKVMLSSVQSAILLTPADPTALNFPEF